jgi:hypothetical protein
MADSMRHAGCRKFERRDVAGIFARHDGSGSTGSVEAATVDTGRPAAGFRARRVASGAKNLWDFRSRRFSVAALTAPGHPPMFRAEIAVAVAPAKA